jgi:hypothetical protein
MPHAACQPRSWLIFDVSQEMSRTFLNLLTTADISAPRTGREVGEVILRSAPSLFPDKIGNWEPISEDCMSPDDFALHWCWPVLAKRRKPRVNFSVWFRGKRRKYSCIFLNFENDIASPADRNALLEGLAILTSSEFGMIQEVSPNYRQRAEEKGLLSFSDKLKKRFSLHLFDEALKNGLPEVFDTMWLPPDAWSVGASNLVAHGSGLFELRDRESASRDEALGHIRKRG